MLGGLSRISFVVKLTDWGYSGGKSTENRPVSGIKSGQRQVSGFAGQAARMGRPGWPSG